MLQELIIDNLALLKHIHVSFRSGMTCLTGETGAGKSILLDALSLAMGSKFDINLLPKNSENPNITAVFLDNSHDSQAYNWLKNNSFFSAQFL